MKIQRGIVKYKDRSDIVCTYALTDDGKQYYFLDENDSKKFSNGNRLATTALVEAVDPMVKAVSVGVIDEAGNVVIPFENRSIRSVNDNVIIVEKAVPTSQNVLDALELKNDPTAATKLVSTPATIKNNLNAQMGTEGKYLFNDQFSEATICDINGTNLVNGETFSFISMANDKLYLSKNVVDSPISELSLTTYELTTVPVASNTDAIDVSATPVAQQVVEDALNAQAANVTAPVEGEVTTPEAPVEGAVAEVPADALANTEVPAAPPVEGAVATPEVPVEGAVAEAPAAVANTEVAAAPVEGAVATPEVPVEGAVAEVPAAVANTEVAATPVEGEVATPEVPVEGAVAEVPAAVANTEGVAAPVEGEVATPEVPVEGAVAEVPAAVANTEGAAAPVEGEVATPEVPVEGAVAEVPAAVANTEGAAAPVEGEVTTPEVPVEGAVAEAPADALANTEGAAAPVEGVTHIDAGEVAAAVGAAEGVADAVDFPIDGSVSNTDDNSEFSTSNDSISDDLKAFTNGTPFDEADDTASPATEENVESVASDDGVPGVAPVASAPVDETPADEVSTETSIETTENVEEDESSEIPPLVEEDDTKEESIVDAVKVDDTEEEEKVEEHVEEHVEETKDEVSEKIEDPVIPAIPVEEEKHEDTTTKDGPVNIDADTVFATVDRNKNGIIDSDEVMIPQPSKDVRHESRSHEDTLLSDLFSERHDEKFRRDYMMDTPSTSYSSSYDSLLSDVKPDHISYSSSIPSGGDNIMDDVARSMSELMRQNKEQKSVISQYQSKLDSLEAQSRMLSDKYKDQTMRYDALSDKLRARDEEASRLESRAQMLESRVRDQERIISSQDRELKVLRPQVESKQDLVRLLADARNLLSSESSYGYSDSYSDDDTYYRRVA